MGYNMFSYCNNNPIGYVDLTGHEPISIGVYLGGVAVGILGLYAFHTTAKLAEEIKTWVITTPRVTEYRDHSVYVLQDPDNKNLVQYVGRTIDPVTRYKQHKNDPVHPERKDYTMKVLVTGLKEREARLVEQMVISAYTLQYLDNARREIATRKVWKYNSYFTSVYNIIEGATEDALINLLLE